jgi:hypothetical protein
LMVDTRKEQFLLLQHYILNWMDFKSSDAKYAFSIFESS